LPQLPLKSRCLRQSSVAKRLRLETSKGAERAKTRGIKKRLSRYRRKTENAKERERMKKIAFENLRQKLPNRDLLSEKSVAGEKDTKVSALRTAISYIKSLQSLVADCDAGRLGEQVYSESRALDSLTNQRPASRSRDSQSGKSELRKRRTRGKRTPASKRQRTEPSPSGLNEVSLHISLLDPSLQPQPAQTQVLYILQLDDAKNIQHLH